MTPDMFWLGERLVLAVESMSKDVNSISLVMRSMGQDVRNISAYIYDLSDIMSHLLKEKRQRKHTQTEPYDAQQEPSAERAHTWESEQADRVSVGQVDEGENDGHFLGNAAAVRPGYNENSDIMSTFPQGITTKVLSDGEEYYELSEKPIINANNNNSAGPSDVPVTQEDASYHLTSNSEYEVVGINEQMSVFADQADFVVNYKSIDTEEFCAEIKTEPENILSVITSEETVKNETLGGVQGSSTVTSISQRGKKSLLVTCSDGGASGFYSCSELNNCEEANRESECLLRQHSRQCGELPRGKCVETLASASLVNKDGMKKDREQSQRQKKTCKSNCSGTEKRCIGTQGKQDSCKEGKWCSSLGKPSQGQSKRQKKTRGPFCCDICQKCFSAFLHLENHKRTHTGEKPFECRVCHKTFITKCNLVLHMKIHSEESVFKCTNCEKAFTRRDHLEEHKRCHSGVKPFKCTVCGKAFSKKYNLTLHMRSHTREKPYECNECRKAFAAKGNLIVHMRSHTGEKPYECQHCKKAFATKSNLNIHVRLHTVENPFTCTGCGKRFKQSCNLSTHIRSGTCESSTCE